MPPDVPRRADAARRRLEIVAVLLCVAVVVILVVGGWIAVSGQALAAAAAPPSRALVVATLTESVAAEAADSAPDDTADRAAADYLAAQPTAFWLTPEGADESDVGGLVLALAQQARDQHATLALVVYGLPGRDCGGLSSGGAVDRAAYDRWTGEIGAALAASRDVRAVVVVEPDSLALAEECGDVDARVAAVRGAVDRLAGDNAFLYLDGGHSQWGAPDAMASLLARVDRADDIRGFATNVANYQPTDAEVAYAHAVAAALGGEAHALIDTSRNGADRATTRWCNPPGALVGAPAGAVGDDVVDANLWIKPPGESDGACGGGPPAGDWWPEAARELTRTVR